MISWSNCSFDFRFTTLNENCSNFPKIPLLKIIFCISISALLPYFTFTDNRNITFSFVDVTGHGTSALDEWIRGDPFSQTRVGNEANPFVENVDVTVQEVYDDEIGFSERLVFIYV